ncbi:MAG: hypothetical protein ABL907_25805 [Hyphomicrobium sp.]
MTSFIDTADVPAVAPEQLLVAMRAAIANGQGLALLNGLSETAIRDLETLLWRHFADDPQTRLAVALRFRALLNVFSARRLKQLFLMNGFKLIARAVAEASSQRLNTTYGFSTQKFVAAMASPPAARRPALTLVHAQAA